MLKIQKITLGVFGTNCYFIFDPETKDCFIVDPADECDVLLNKIAKNNFNLNGILLTHAHFDHIMALEPLRNATNAEVMLHADEQRILCDNSLNLMDVYGDGSQCRAADRLLSDGDLIDLAGNKLKVMHTPGHTPGSCCYIFDNNILCGDTLFREGYGRYDFPCGNYRQLVDSARKIAALDGDFKLFPGHGAATTLEHERQFNIILL